MRSNGMATYRAEAMPPFVTHHGPQTNPQPQEMAQFGRMLTIFALYESMTGDSEFILGHFLKIKALGNPKIHQSPKPELTPNAHANSNANSKANPNPKPNTNSNANFNLSLTLTADTNR